jgi:hypothetical protein
MNKHIKKTIIELQLAHDLKKAKNILDHNGVPVEGRYLIMSTPFGILEIKDGKLMNGNKEAFNWFKKQKI